MTFLKHLLKLFLLSAVTLPILTCSAEESLANNCKSSTTAWNKMGQLNISLYDEEENKFNLRAKIANDSEEIMGGYQWLCNEIIKDSAVLFVFPKPFDAAFHMENVFVPLDVFFFDKKGNLVHQARMNAEPPGSNIEARLYQPDTGKLYRYVLELPASEYSSKLKSSKNLKLTVR